MYDVPSLCGLPTGASLTASYSGTIEQEVVTTDSLTYQMTVTGSLTATSAADSIHTVMLAYFGDNLDSAVSAGTVYTLVAGVPADGCSALSYPYALPGKVVMLSRGNCTFEAKVGEHKGNKLVVHFFNQVFHDVPFSSGSEGHPMQKGFPCCIG